MLTSDLIAAGRPLGLRGAGSCSFRGRNHLQFRRQLVDRIARFMQQWKGGGVHRVDDYLDEHGMRRHHFFRRVLQLIIELAKAGRGERSVLESLGNHIRALGRFWVDVGSGKQTGPTTRGAYWPANSRATPASKYYFMRRKRPSSARRLDRTELSLPRFRASMSPNSKTDG